MRNAECGVRWGMLTLELAVNLRGETFNFQHSTPNAEVARVCFKCGLLTAKSALRVEPRLGTTLYFAARRAVHALMWQKRRTGRSALPDAGMLDTP